METEKQRKASSQESSQQTGGGENVLSNHTAHFEECSGHSDVLLAQNVLKEDQRKNKANPRNPGSKALLLHIP